MTRKTLVYTTLRHNTRFIFEDACVGVRSVSHARLRRRNNRRDRLARGKTDCALDDLAVSLLHAGADVLHYCVDDFVPRNVGGSLDGLCRVDAALHDLVDCTMADRHRRSRQSPHRRHRPILAVCRTDVVQLGQFEALHLALRDGRLLGATARDLRPPICGRRLKLRGKRVV